MRSKPALEGSERMLSLPITNYQLPTTNYQCPITNPLCPMPNLI
ncbi:MAG: hypothetical protein AAF630_20305 [Cyanobacteria bacterium P01_C01_bin.38]